MDYLIAHPFVALAIAGVIAALILFGLVLDLRRRWNAVFGRGARAGRDALGESLKRLAADEAALRSHGARLAELETIARTSISKVGFKRFNPFDGVGGDQSFSAALLDHQGDGIIISSLYTREGVRVYAKKVEAGASKHPLSREEQEVLAQAMKTEAWSKK